MAHISPHAPLHASSAYAAPTAGCPVAHREDRPKTARGDVPDGSGAVEQRGDVWHVRSHAAVRQVLRDAEATRQAGFNSEAMRGSTLKQPVLFQDGEEHRKQRTAIARFFTPKTVGTEYRALMEQVADTTVAELARRGHGDLDALSMALAVQVAARVVGLTDSRGPGMDRRLDALLGLERLEGASALRRGWSSVLSWSRMLSFYWMDVRPAIAARRRSPREDVISHLLAHDYNDMEVLIECITYGAAGMATTREFIGVVAWHLLGNPSLRTRYLAAGESARHRILHEILRLEPVVGKLYRRAVRDVRIEVEDQTWTIPAGARIALDIRAANLDTTAVGADPLAVCPRRDLAPGVQPPVMSFGDGVHRCPGASIAIQESDIFLTRLLRLPLRIVREPSVTWNDLIESYELRGFTVEVTSA